MKNINVNKIWKWMLDSQFVSKLLYGYFEFLTESNIIDSCFIVGGCKAAGRWKTLTCGKTIFVLSEGNRKHHVIAVSVLSLLSLKV